MCVHPCSVSSFSVYKLFTVSTVSGQADLQLKAQHLAFQLDQIVTSFYINPAICDPCAESGGTNELMLGNIFY